jgi:hypothetical protein
VLQGTKTRPPAPWPFAKAKPSSPALTAMFKQIIANNRAGGWRKLKPKQ